MTSALPPSLPATPAPAPTPVQAAAPTFSITSASGVATAAQVAPILAAAQAALAQPVNLSPQAQQAIKAEAFAQLVAQMVQSIQGGSVQLPTNWPVGGVTPQWQALLQALIQQASQGQPLPQQLVNVQSWPSALALAVLQNAAAGPSLPPPALSTLLQGTAAAPAPLTPSTPAAPGGPGLPPALNTSGPASLVRPALPTLQNWLVQQGVVQGPDGDRAFTLTLRVPVAWAQAQSVLGQALGAPSAAAGAGGAAAVGASVPGSALLLPYGSSVLQLSNATFGLVLQPQGLPAAQAQALRTSAVLQLEFQPLPNAAASAVQQTAAAVLVPGAMLPQEAYQALLARSTDPWLQMHQMQASGQLPRERQHGNPEGQCNVAGCQYQGRAECAQPFCAEMNSLWAASRSSRL